MAERFLKVLKVDHKTTLLLGEMYLKLSLKTPEQGQLMSF